jgi:hypothetical protein
MKCLALSIGPQLKVSLIDYQGTTTIELDGELLRKRSNEVSFYDWWAAPDGAIQALDIHECRDNPVFETVVPLAELTYVESRPFFLIWLTDRRDALESGLEAFGDLFFFENRAGQLTILVGIENWLSTQQRHNLLGVLQAT